MKPLTCSECDAFPAYLNPNFMRPQPLCREHWTEHESVMSRQDAPGIALPFPADEEVIAEAA